MQIFRHAANHQALLVVLLAEHRHIGGNQLEQLEHDGGDAAEVSRPEPALQGRGDLRRLDEGRESRRVHLLGRRREYQIDTAPRQRLEVRLPSARILLQILLRTELRRVDKNRDDREVAFLMAAADEAQMPVVERAHRGNQAKSRVRTAGCGHRRPHLAAGRHDARLSGCGECLVVGCSLRKFPHRPQRG